MLAVAANNVRAKQRVAAVDAWPDMQPAYDSADDQDHGSPPPKEQQTQFGEVQAKLQARDQHTEGEEFDCTGLVKLPPCKLYFYMRLWAS